MCLLPGLPVSSLLHVRGGVSEAEMAAVIEAGSSPRPWRCF